ncbi:substrate-binding periplasmic protein [Pseudoalteromonas sp. T1lg23B]|uniref:substrate-binding periplasmic protein n=1 Tax=Pseudoalteromonas sp. T1lg23B TaxID=2077097 RepID=UPI000CF67290|nr:ABC transporter substrate-binding protein [Pseudoalteromonas sp. T1lg23B]
MSSSGLVAAKQVVTIYAYHLKAPYIIDVEQEQGLYFDFALLLNQYQSEHVFKIEFMPRKRLNRDIEQSTLDGLIIGVNPVWFRDRQQKKFAWSEPFMTDRDEFVSNIKAPFEFAGQASLYGKTIGGVRGYHYFQVAPAVKIGKADQLETSTELQLLEMVVKQRLEIAVISKSTMNYLLAMNKHWDSEIHLSEQPHESYTRSLLAPKDMSHLIELINGVLQKSKFKQELKQMLMRYHVTDSLSHIKS